MAVDLTRLYILHSRLVTAVDAAALAGARVINELDRDAQIQRWFWANFTRAGAGRTTGFLGAENKPMPISEKEAMHILHKVQEGVERPKASVSFEIGENVRVADGPFASFSGVVEEIDEARSRVKVAVSIFGRATPVELEVAQVEKV